jgi:hypothetical protein
LHARLREDSNFAASMIRYLNSIIMHGIDVSVIPDLDVNLSNIPRNERRMMNSLPDYIKIAMSWPVRNSGTQKVTANCFKYGRRGKNGCRFGMPRDLVPNSIVDEFGIIHRARNDAWINPWNPAIASCIRSNQDIYYF